MISIALGMNPDYRYLVADRMSTKMAMRITQKCRDSSAIPFATANDIIIEGYLNQLSDNGEQKIQIFGAYEDLCVAYAVRRATESGLTTLVPKRFVVKSAKKSRGLIKSLNVMNQELLDIVPFQYSQDEENYIIQPS